MPDKATTVVIVGCGAAGVTAAIGLARRKIPTIVVEGALYPGAENWSGAVYFCENLVRPEILGPKGLEQTAWERKVVKRGMLFSDGRVAVGGAIHSRTAFEHCYTVLRPIFDHDLAQRARIFGAQVLSDTTATALIRDGDKVLGVLTDRGPIYADLTFLAEGDASNLVTREGLERKPASPHGLPEPEFLQGIKEVVALDPKLIESRFGITAGEGACFEVLLRNASLGGRPVPLNAGAFLYTNRDSVSVGIVAPLSTLSKWTGDHNRLMEWLKQLPAIRPLLEGGETVSFGAKVIRGGGYKEMPRLVLDGLAVGGAAAGLGVDFPCPNYTGPATYCGFLLSEAAHKLLTENHAFDEAGLTRHYLAPLTSSHYFADTRHLAEWPHFVATTREFFGRQVDLVAGSSHILTTAELGVAKRHFVFARYLYETVKGKLGVLRGDAKAAQKALGMGLGGWLSLVPRWIANVVLGFLPRKPATDAAFVPVFWADPKSPRQKPPLSVRFLRWRFATSLGDALFHLYRNDPVSLSEKLPAAQRAVLARLSLLDFLLAPFLFAFNWVVGFFHQLFFKIWVGLTKPPLEKILATPFFRLRESARAIADASLAPEPLSHDAKLALITYKGEKKSHIDFHVAYDKAGLPSVDSPVFHVCPANVYREEQDQSLAPSVTVLHENCVRCETCWRADPLHVDWGRTRAQRLIFEAYSPADAWLTESLEAASLVEHSAADAADGARASSAEGRSAGLVEASHASTSNPPASSAGPQAIRPASPELAPLLSRIRSSASGFRPLHDSLPPVLLGGDQDLLARVASDCLSALSSLVSLLQPSASSSPALSSRLSALSSFQALASAHLASRRFFHLEADFTLLLTHHLPLLEELLGPPPSTPSAKTASHAGPQAIRPASASTARTRLAFRKALESKLTKDVLHASASSRAPAPAADETLRWALRGLLPSSAPPPLPGSTPRDVVLEELARLSPGLALLASQHLNALDCLTRLNVSADPEDLEELRSALSRVRALSCVVDAAFTLSDDLVSGSAPAVALGGVQLLILPLPSDEIAIVGRSDPGVSVTTPGSLGLLEAGLSHLAVSSARPRARLRGVKARGWVQVHGGLDAVAIARGAADYLRSRALDHASSRVQFPGLFRDLRGRDGIAKFGAVQAMLAEIEAATVLLDSLRGWNGHGAATASLAADLLGPGPRSVSYLAGQVLGGTAYSEEDPVCRLFRDAATLTRVPVDAEAAARAHGRRQLELARGSAGDATQLIIGLHLHPVGFEDRPGDPADLGARLAPVRAAFADLKKALASAAPASLEGLSGDLGRLTLLGAAFALFVEDLRDSRARGEIDAREDAACEHWAIRLADRARRLTRRLPDCAELVDLGRRLFEPGVSEGPAGASGATYAEYLGDGGEFTSGDLFARPRPPGALVFSPELLEADPVLREADASTRASYRERWRDRDFDGLRYQRLLEHLHHIPLTDVEWLVTSGHFRQVIPETLGGLGRKKALYYVSCTNLMRHGDPAHALVVMGSTSIGTTPITIGLDQDLPAARRAVEALLARPESVREIDSRISRVLAMSATADALKIEAPFQELMGLVKKTLQSEKVLRLAFQGFLDAFMNAGRAGLKKDLPSFRKHLTEARSHLSGWESRLSAERDSLPHREAMHRFYLQSIASGRISAFALTEPSAGSDTARIRTRATLTEVEATPDPRGFYTFTPAGSSEPRNLFTLDRLEWCNAGAQAGVPNRASAKVGVETSGLLGSSPPTECDAGPQAGVPNRAPATVGVERSSPASQLVFVAPDSSRHAVSTRDFRYEPGDGPSKYRYVTLAGEDIPIHDMGRVVVRDGRHYFPYYRVDGAKMWITNGSVAGVMVLYARTDRGPTGFMLDAHQEGLSVGKDEAKMGQRGSNTNELALKDVRVPVDAIIGIEGRGQENALETLNVGRAGLSITACGLMHEIVSDVRESLAAQSRTPSAEDFRQLGKMALDLVGSESLAWFLCGRFDHHGTKSTRVESAVGKAETSEALHRLLRRAERICGPFSTLAFFELEKKRRDARVLTIYEGTNEVQRFLVLKDLIDVLPADLAPVSDEPLVQASAAAYAANIPWSGPQAGSTSSVASTPQAGPQAIRPASPASASTSALSTSRSEVMSRVTTVRASLSSRAWQKVHLQPWVFSLVESYMACSTLAAARARVSLAHRLLGQGSSSAELVQRGTAGLQPCPRLAYLDLALSLLSRSVSSLPSSLLASFDAVSSRVSSGLDLLPTLLSDRALLSHDHASAEPSPAPLASSLPRPVRILVVVDPAPSVAPRPRIRSDRLAEPLLELSAQDRSALSLALALRSSSASSSSASPQSVHICVLALGTPSSSPVLRECLALGADSAFLINLGPRPVLGGDIAEFASNLISFESEEHGPFDLILGAERSSGFLLPLSRRLDLEPLPSVLDFALGARPSRLEAPTGGPGSPTERSESWGGGLVEASASAASTSSLQITARLSRPATTVTLPTPAVLLVSSESSPASSRFSISGWRSSLSAPIRVLEFSPRSDSPGRLVAANGVRASTSADSAPSGPLDPAAAAAEFASVAQLASASSSSAGAFSDPITELSASEFLSRLGVVAVVSAASDGLTPSALSALRAASWSASHLSVHAGALLLIPSEDETAIRSLLAPIASDFASLDFGLVTLPDLALLTDRRLSSLLESILSSSAASTVFSSDLRPAALLAAEGRLAAGSDLPFMDGIDRLESQNGSLVFSGARLDGRARYVASRSASSPFQLIARSDVSLSGARASASEASSARPGLGVAEGAPGPSARVVALLTGISIPPDSTSDLSRALREAQSELAVSSLTDAEFIIDVGYGVGSRDGIEEVIDPLKAALERLGVRRVMVGASRKVTQDLGLLPDSAQIGQTGVAVAPRVLLAVGISGAPQHLNYIGDRSVIFAFNRDPEAPMMVLNRSRPRPRVFPILGDLFVEVPRFIAALHSHAHVRDEPNQSRQP